MYRSDIKQIFSSLKSLDFSRAALFLSSSDWLFMWAVNYLPFNYPENIFWIDSYYLASHKTFLQTKKLIDFLRENGVESEIFKGDYKQTAADLKLGVFLKNRLVCVNKSSYCCLAAVYGNLDGGKDNSDCLKDSQTVNNSLLSKKENPNGIEQKTDVQFSPNESSQFDEVLFFGEEKKQKTCLDCNKCIDACPSKALSLDGWEREKCLRQVQENGGGTSLSGSSQLLGCDLCQRACPLNFSVEAVTPPVYLLQLLQKSTFEENLDDKQKLNNLAQLIGTNYARKSKLMPILKWLLGESANDGANCKKQR